MRYELPEYEGLLKQVAGAAPRVFIMGGIAEEALLFGRVERLHKDLDLLARDDELGQLLEQLAALGLGRFEAVLADSDGRPRLLSGQAGPIEIEIYVASPAPGGGYQFEVPPQGPAGRLRLFAPADTFQYPATTIAGITIQTVSPLALCWMRAASAQTRNAGVKQASDLARLAQLRQAFLAGYDEAELKPRIEEI